MDLCYRYHLILLGGGGLTEETIARIESELEVKAYIQDLKFALNNGAKINFQVKRPWMTIEMKCIQISIRSIRYLQMRIRQMR